MRRSASMTSPAPILFAAWMLLASAAVGEPLQPKHVAQLRLVTAATVSPDGRLVAYTLSVPRRPLADEDGPAWSELHVVPASGEAPSRPYITGKVGIGAPQWLPDGGALLYLARRNDDKAPSLYRIPIDGGESQRVLTHPGGIQGFAVSQDGAQLAYLATEESELAAKELRDKGFNQEVFEEDWQPVRVWLTTLDGDGPPRKLDLPGSASAVEWSPSGKELVVVLAPTPGVDDDLMHRRVHLVDAVSGHVLQKLDNPGKLGEVAWSPDGRHVAMISGADIHDPHEGQLLVASATDGALRNLLPDVAGHVSSFAWQDATTLVYVGDVGTKTVLGRVTLEGANETLLGPAGPVLAGLTLSADGVVGAVTGHTAQFPAEVHTFQLKQQPPLLERRTRVNPWLAGIDFAQQETIRWQASDGLEIEGVLIYPLGYVEGRRYPTILSVHGGPESHEPDGWLTSYGRPGQVAAARGFAVFSPNYRGSTGRGVEFSKLGQADAAGKEFDDLVEGIDHLVKLGIVDRDRVGITGGSYGGYASAWGATFYSERFAASVMFVGISDNVSKVGTTDIPEEMFLVHHRKRLWEDWEYFLSRSPIRYVERNRTPTLILHGKQDPRVHPSQSLELHRHLKTLGQAPVRLVLYEGEGHGNRKAAARLDYHLRMLQWMEHYLQGPGGPAPPFELDYESAMK